MEYQLERFHRAQQRDYAAALAEIKAGRKRSHWIWYIFPQLTALGFSSTARFYGIRDAGEAKAYLADPVLRSNLLEITEALLALPCSDPGAVMGTPDDLKLRSSMTLFSAVAPEQPEFRQVLEKFYGGEPDRKTLKLLGIETLG